MGHAIQRRDLYSTQSSGDIMQSITTGRRLSVAARLLAASLCLFGAAAEAQVRHKPTEFIRGVNLAGGEFGSGKLPGTFNKHYVYPGRSYFDQAKALNMKAVRMPVRWERIQHNLYGSLDRKEMWRIDQRVKWAEERGMLLILDLHNYGKYHGTKVTDSSRVGYALPDVWRRIADRYDTRRVAFNIMNEPYDMHSKDWAKWAQRVVLAIRNTGAKNLILVPGSHWSGAHSWQSKRDGWSNGDAFRSFYDPGNNFAYDMHQYLDRNSSGTSDYCVDSREAKRRIKVATDWLRKYDERAFLGEFGAATSSRCLESMKALLDAVERAPDAWIGWTYWAGGPWWGKDYRFRLDDNSGGGKRRRTILRDRTKKRITLPK